MFNDTDNGQTQYCPMCLEWAEKYKKLKAENERLSELTCVNCGEKFLSPTGSELYEKIVQLKAENEKLKNEIFDEGLIRENCKYYKQVCSENTQLIAYRNALEEVREITKKYYLSDKKLLATGIGIDPYGAIIEIQDRINEVLEDEI